MKAMQIDRYGGPEELYVAEIPVPSVGPGQVLIRVAYASVNPADWKARAGLLGFIDFIAFPKTIGMDCSGVVAAVGEGVSNFAPGDKVISTSGMAFGMGGTYAEFNLSPAPRVALLPPPLSLAEGATIPCAGASAASSIVDVAKTKAGDMVLVNGGAGSVGTFGIQFLKYLGACVAATCSTRNVEHVRQLGADLVIDYTAEDIAASIASWAPDGLDSVIDAVGQHSLPRCTPDLIRPGGKLVCIQNLLTGVEAFDLDLARQRDVCVVDNLEGARIGDPIWGQVMAFRQLLEGVAAGAIKPPPFEIWPFEDAPDAQARVAEGHVRGKILLKIADLEA